MKKLIAILLAALMICSLFVGCAKTEEPVVEPETETEAPAVEGEESLMDKYGFEELDIMAFEGGNIGLWDERVELVKSYYPGDEVKADISSDIANRIRSRMMTDDQPDWVLSSGSEWSYTAAARAGQMLDLADFYANGVNADGVPMNQIVTPDMLADCYVGDEIIKAPTSASYLGWWYNVNMFNELGIEPPKTWDELYAVAEVLNENDIIPFMYQFPSYGLWGMSYQIVAAFGGRELYNDCYVTLTEGAWTSEAALKAITAQDNLVKDGILSPLSAGADFTAAQVDFVNGRIGIIPNGTWFENEMAEVTPEDFDMAFIAFPAAEEGGNRYVVTSVSGGQAIKGGDNAAALAWLGVLYSDEGQKLFAKYGSFPISQAMDASIVEEYMTPANFTAFQAAQESDVEFLSNGPESWYGDLQDAVKVNNDNICLQDMTPEEYCEAIEAAAEKCRNDENVTIREAH